MSEALSKEFVEPLKFEDLYPGRFVIILAEKGRSGSTDHFVRGIIKKVMPLQWQVQFAALDMPEKEAKMKVGQKFYDISLSTTALKAEPMV
jgi:hypothetical protein